VTDIHSVMAAMWRAHTCSPSERVAQLMFNALDMDGRARMADGTPRDIFYVTNEELANALTRYADRISSTVPAVLPEGK